MQEAIQSEDGEEYGVTLSTLVVLLAYTMLMGIAIGVTVAAYHPRPVIQKIIPEPVMLPLAQHEEPA